MDIIKQITEKMKSLDLSNFSGTKKTGFFSRGEYTVMDFFITLNAVEKEVTTLINELSVHSSHIINMMSISDAHINIHKQLVDELEAHIIAGKVTLERNSRKLFKEHNEDFLVDKFNQRIMELTQYEHMCLLSFEQVKLSQNNLMSMATNAQSMATITFPLWKASFNTLFSKIQSSGNVSMSTPINSLHSDPDFQNVNKTTTTIISTLNHKA
jgi:uncharacterized protein YaaN involved in tellurite resistance